MTRSSLKSGFTFIELSVVMGVMTIILGVAVISLTSLQNRSNFASTLSLLISDIKQQQIKAMVGDTEGRATSDSYGIHLDNTAKTYTFFHGTTYVPGASSNFPVSIDSYLSFSSISLPDASNNIIFSQVSGEIYHYSSSTRSFTFKNTSNNEQKTIQFNRYGVITSVN